MRTNKWWMLGAVSAGTFMLLLDVTVINVALPDMQRALGATFADLQWVIDAYALALAAFLLGAGKLADQWGRRRVFLAGTALFVVASLACGLATTSGALIVARAVEGVGGAVMYAVAPALIAHDFHGRQRGIAFGISGGVTGLAVAVGPLLGGALTAVSWRWIFLLNVPIGVAVLLVIATKVAESRVTRRRPIDWAGIALFSTALALLVFSLIRGESLGWTSPALLGMFTAVLLLGGAFVLLQRLRREPMLDPRLFLDRSYTGLAAATLAVNAAVGIALLMQVLYLQYTLGFTALGTGLRFLPLTLAIFVTAAVAGTVSTRAPARLMVGMGCVLVGVGLFAAARVDLSSSWTHLLPGMVLAGAGVGLFNPARAATAVALVPEEQAGTSSAVSETFQQGGVALGVAALGSLAHARIHDSFSATVYGSSAVPQEQADQLGRLVSAGRFPEVVAAADPATRVMVIRAANQALIDGLNSVLVVGGILVLLGAAIAIIAMRTHIAVPAAAPPEPAGPAEVESGQGAIRIATGAAGIESPAPSLTRE